MTEYIENRRHVMERNPNFRGEPYPCEGEPGDKEKGCSPIAASACRSSTRSSFDHREGEACRARRSSCRATTTSPAIERLDYGHRD